MYHDLKLFILRPVAKTSKNAAQVNLVTLNAAMDAATRPRNVLMFCCFMFSLGGVGDVGVVDGVFSFSVGVVLCDAFFSVA